MKKITAYLIIFVLLFSFVACGESNIDVSQVDDSTQSADSSLAEQDESSKPRDETTVPDSYVSDSPESSAPQESAPEESVPEVSEPEEFEPEESDTSEQPEISFESSELSENAAKGYKIVYTKVKPINAVSCCSDGDVCAVYDGEITRFFNALNGEFYYAERGKWIVPGCGDGFVKVNESTGEFKWYPSIFFSLDPQTNELLYIDHNREHGHGFGYSYNFYETSTGKIYSNSRDDDGYRLCQVKGIFVCFEWETVEPSILLDYDDDSRFNEMIAGKKYGLAKDGRVVVPFEYDYMDEGIGSISYPGVVMAVKDGKTYYIATDGTVLNPEGFDCGTFICEKRAWVFKDGQGYIIEFY